MCVGTAVLDTFIKRIIIRGEDYGVAVKEEGLKFFEFNHAGGVKERR